MSKMRYTTLGRTGLPVSIIGLGASTRFGKLIGPDLPRAERILQTAFDQGIDLIDTAAIYNQSEEILGRLLKKQRRESYVLTSKYFPIEEDGRPMAPEKVRETVESSLKLLDTDYLDVLQIHGVRPESYQAIVELHHDILKQLQTEGKFRYLGITETIRYDPWHKMMHMALEDDLFDTAMIAYNLLSPDPEVDILPKCKNQKVGVIGMTAARPTLCDNSRLEALISKAKAEGRIGPDALPDSRSLDWLLDDSIATVATAGYSYVLAEPAVCTVLSGTTDPNHLIENVRSALATPLSKEKRLRLQSIFRTPPNHEPWSTYDL
ncbi:MAG: aldo/keto reductase [Cyanothece sp. SIO1E1]|nr:aldo/keto reductase [Cyanothece sp. SIO1E1]